MPFSETLKTKVRRQAHFACCLCKSIGVEIHHIIPQEENGPDSEENAAPLCPSCHETYGANPTKRKFIREARDLWYEICEKRYASDSDQIDAMVSLLANINAHVRSSNYPLLPFAMFYTLRHTTTEAAIERAFKNTRGFKSLKKGPLQLEVVATLGGYGMYNAIKFRPSESHCQLSEEALRVLIEEQGYLGESAIKHPMDTTLRIEFPNRDGVTNDSILTLKKAFEGDGKPRNVKKLELFDDTIFQDTFFTGWEVGNPSKRAWSIGDLQGAKLRLDIEFLSHGGINFAKPPKLHNLHLYFGRETPHILYFTAEQLEEPEILEESSVPMNWNLSEIGLDTRPLLMRYDLQVDDEIYFNQVKQVA